MMAWVERNQIKAKDSYPDIVVYRCSICGELLTRTIGEVRGRQKNRFCPNCGIALRWPEDEECGKSG